MTEDFLTNLATEGISTNEFFHSLRDGGFTEHQALILTAHWLAAIAAQERMEWIDDVYDDDEGED